MARKLINLFSLSLIILFLGACGSAGNSGGSSYETKADSIIALMTLDEKIGQLNLPAAGDITTGLANSTGIAKKIKEGKVGALFNIRGLDKIRKAQKVAVEESRLGIPLIFAMDVIHGYKTVFPIPLGVSCTWDMELVEQSARIAAREATSDGIAWTFSPMTDISRDPRWGRFSEGSGEDPYLGSRIAEAMVKGYQQDDLSHHHTMMACVKHFALYGASEAGRDYNTVDMSRLRMHNDYFPPYKAAVDAGVGTVMASFNEVDGVPATGNKWLMTEVLRNAWGFDGFIVTDYTGINEMTEHGVGDTLDVTALALNAGIDMDMVSDAFLNKTKEAIEKGMVTEAQVDQAVKRILVAKYELGLFDDPYKYMDETRSKEELYNAENRGIARKIAAESLVLLQNEGDVLPLAKNGTIALIGPLADNRENMTGTWSVAADFKNSISLKEGIEQVAGNQVKILHARGSNIYADPELEARVSIFGKPTYRDSRSEEEMIREAVQVAKSSDVVIAAVGEAAEMAGESSSRTDIQIPDTQQRLLEALVKTGKPVVLVLFNGRPLVLKWEKENIPAILDVWFAGSEGGLAIADVLFGDVNPSGKLSATFPQNLGQVPLFYNHKNTGRPVDQWFSKFKSNYLDVSNEPLFPFGYGLSYSNFTYKNLSLSTDKISMGQKLTVSIDVTNESNVAGKEVVQLYLRDVIGTTTRPLKELKGFEKVMIEAGATKTIRFEIDQEDLAYYHQDMSFFAEPGEFHVMVGGNSSDVLSASFQLTQ